MSRGAYRAALGWTSEPVGDLAEFLRALAMELPNDLSGSARTLGAIADAFTGDAATGAQPFGVTLKMHGHKKLAAIVNRFHLARRNMEIGRWMAPQIFSVGDQERIANDAEERFGECFKVKSDSCAKAYRYFLEVNDWLARVRQSGSPYSTWPAAQLEDRFHGWRARKQTPKDDGAAPD